jgi:hypothetical protein
MKYGVVHKSKRDTKVKTPGQSARRNKVDFIQFPVMLGDGGGYRSDDGRAERGGGKFYIFMIEIINPSSF